MKDIESERITCKRVREEVTGGSTVDNLFNCSWDDLNVVLEGWKKIKENYKKIGVEVFQNLFIEHPFYKKLFPSFADVLADDLIYNEDFKIHSYAVMRGLNSVMCNFSAKYEDENEILPVIGYTHYKRGIPLGTMNHLKETLLSVCCDFLDSDKKEKASWKVVLDFIFDYYLFRAYPSEDEKSTENQ